MESIVTSLQQILQQHTDSVPKQEIQKVFEHLKREALEQPASVRQNPPPNSLICKIFVDPTVDPTAVETARNIKSALPSKYHSAVSVVELNQSLEDLETVANNSSHIVLLVTRSILENKAARFVLRCAIDWNIRSKLIHHAVSCTFPNYPPELKDAFRSKAITHIKEYTKNTVSDLMNFFEPPNSNNAVNPLSVFISYKRTTGSAIAPRLWEGLHRNYNVFLDSEARFELHDLEMLANNADIFVFVLTQGILDSKFCVAELISALSPRIDHSPRPPKKQVLLRHFEYNLTEINPDLPENVKNFLRQEPLVWAPELHSACLQQLINEHLGPPDEELKKLGNPNNKYEKLNRVELWGLGVRWNKPQEYVTTFEAIGFKDDDWHLMRFLPMLETLTISNSEINLGFEHLCKCSRLKCLKLRLPNLFSLDITLFPNHLKELELQSWNSGFQYTWKGFSQQDLGNIVSTLTSLNKLTISSLRDGSVVPDIPWVRGVTQVVQTRTKLLVKGDNNIHLNLSGMNLVVDPGLISNMNQVVVAYLISNYSYWILMTNASRNTLQSISCDQLQEEDTQLLQYVAQCRAITKLLLPNCNNSSLCGVIQSLNNLSVLNLSKANVNDTVVAAISRLQLLMALSLADCTGVTNTSLSKNSFQCRRTLKLLDLSRCDLDDLGFFQFTQFAELESLILSQTKVVYLHLQQGRLHWAKLKHLFVDNTYAEPTVAQVLSQSTCIECVSFYGCNSMCKGTRELQMLFKCPSLLYVNLINTKVPNVRDTFIHNKLYAHIQQPETMKATGLDYGYKSGLLEQFFGNPDT